MHNRPARMARERNIILGLLRMETHRLTYLNRPSEPAKSFIRIRRVHAGSAAFNQLDGGTYTGAQISVGRNRPGSRIVYDASASRSLLVRHAGPATARRNRKPGLRAANKRQRCKKHPAWGPGA